MAPTLEQVRKHLAEMRAFAAKRALMGDCICDRPNPGPHDCARYGCFCHGCGRFIPDSQFVGNLMMAAGVTEWPK
jgi:hypothetical protein